VINSISDLREGQDHFATFTIGDSELSTFVRLTGDTAPVHTDPVHAADMGFGGLLVHGLLVGSMYSRLLGCELPGPNTVISKLSLDMMLPVFVGDTLVYKVVVSRLHVSVGAVALALSASNKMNQIVNRGSAVCVFRDLSNFRKAR
jgi:3-hydroxybutyryl-CoA dehydratase